MATLQTLRNKGPLLIIVVGIALLAFIAGDAFKLFESNSYETTVGTVGEEEVSIQEFEQFRNEYGVYSNVQDKMTLSLGFPVQEKSGEEIRNLAWSIITLEKALKEYPEELGLQVTSEEVNYVLENVPELHSSIIEYPCPFTTNLMGGTFDVNRLGSFLDQYAQMESEGEITPEYKEMHTYWKVLERIIKLRLTTLKIDNVYRVSTIANKAVADKEIKLGNDTINAEIAKFAISDVMDSVKVSDEEIAEYYNKNIRYRKEWHNLTDSRAVKYAYIKVLPSDEDRENARIAMQTCTDTLRNGYNNNKRLTRITQSEDISNNMFNGLYLTSGELYTDIRTDFNPQFGPMVASTPLDPSLSSRIEMSTINEVFDPQLVGSDRENSYYYVIKNNSMLSLPKDLTLSYAIITHNDKKTLDANAASLVDSLNKGGDFAKLTEGYSIKYDSVKFETGMTFRYVLDAANQEQLSRSMQREIPKDLLATSTFSQAMENDSIQIDIYNSSTENYQAKDLPSGKKIVFKIHEKSSDSVNVYKPLIMRRKIVYSDKTYKNELDAFNKFVAGCKNISELEANVEKSNKYTITDVQFMDDLTSRIYLNEMKYVNGMPQRASVNASGETTKIILDENIEVGSLTNVIKCGENNSIFMVAAIEDDYNKGYMSLTQNMGNGATLYDLIKAEIQKEKATAKLIGDVKKMSDNEMTYTPIFGIEYGNPVQVAPNIQDLVVSAVAAKLNVGEKSAPFSGKNIMSGEDYVYVVKVTEKIAKKDNKLDTKGVHDRTRGQIDPYIISKVLTEKSPAESNFRKF
ncbi:MAG: SurA N-terminal domain-containing protein [Bacteroidaceae bacterium]|nr:SurA N-terminal domain-containing protein [Bacteroidaceae bacterium]